MVATITPRIWDHMLLNWYLAPCLGQDPPKCLIHWLAFNRGVALDLFMTFNLPSLVGIYTATG